MVVGKPSFIKVIIILSKRNGESVAGTGRKREGVRGDFGRKTREKERRMAPKEGSCVEFRNSACS